MVAWSLIHVRFRGTQSYQGDFKAEHEAPGRKQYLSNLYAMQPMFLLPTRLVSRD